MRSSRVTGSRSSSLYAGMTTDSDFVGSEKIDGGETYKGRPRSVATSNYICDGSKGVCSKQALTFSKDDGSSRKCCDDEK